MRIIIIIAADLFIAAVSLFAASEFFGLRRFDSFTVPYTDKLISAGVIDAASRERVLRSDRLNHLAGMGVSALTCALMSAFLAWPSGLIVAVAAFAGAIVLLHPDMTETDATREGYYRLHKSSINPQRYAELVQRLRHEDTAAR